jgi:transitional endoplasmic reticulum ATPase
LKDNKDVEFPDKLCEAIAEITDKFSFAYIQEAFVASLLAIARDSDKKRSRRDSYELLTEDLGEGWVGLLTLEDHEHKELDKYVLWVEMKKQVQTLREGMEDAVQATVRV